MLTQHLEKLNHFVGVVRHGSIRSYANAVQLSQPSITKAIQNLESVLEVSLLIRNVNGTVTTAPGHELFVWAEEVLSQAIQLESKIRGADGEIEDDIMLGVYPSIGVYFIPQFYEFLKRRQRKLKIQFISAPSAALVSLLRSGKVDCSISIDPPDVSELFRVELFADTYSLYRARGSLLRFGQADIFTLLSAKDQRGRSLEDYIEAAKLKKHLVGCGDFEGAKAMLELDLGLAMLPERVASPLLNNGRIERMPGPHRLDRIGVHKIIFSCKRYRADDSAMKWVAEQLHNMLRNA